MKIIKKLKKRYSNLKSITKASLWYTISNFLQKIIVVISVPVITRMLTATEYGMYSVYDSWFEIIYNFCTLALASGGYFVGMKNHANNKYKYDSAICSLCFVITSFLFILFSTVPFLWKAILSLPVAYQLPMFIGIISGCPRDFWATSERYGMKYKKLVLVTILTSIGVLFSQIICISIAKENEYNNVQAVIWGGVIPSVVVGLPILISIFNKGRQFFDKSIWKETISFNVVLIPYYMSITFLNQIDRVMIERFIDSAHAGYYSVAYRAASTINILTVALNQSLMPWIFQKLKDNQQNEIRKISTIILLIPFSISLIMVLLAPEIILILSGKEYLTAAVIIPSVAMGMCLRFVSQFFVNVEMYYEKNNIITISTIVVAVLNFILNWFCIPRFGYVSAGYTTLVCFGLQSAIHSIIVSKYLGNKKMFNYVLIWTFILCAIVISILFSFIYNMVVVRYFLVSVFAITIIGFRDRIKFFIKKISDKSNYKEDGVV